MLPWLERSHHWGYLLTLALVPYWWHLVLVRGAHEGVYYLYDSLLLFASDAFLLLTLFIWAAARLLARRPLLRWWQPLGVTAPLGLVVAATFLSVASSLDGLVSLYMACHLALMWLLVLYTVQEHPEPGALARVFVVSAVIQVGFVVAQMYTQTTFPLGTLILGWERELPASQPGASVVETVAGTRWLRAYGSFPHPNILGGYLSAASFPMAALFLSAAGGVSALALALFAATMAALALTFSRAAWLSFLTGMMPFVALFLRSRQRALLRLPRAAELLGATLVVWLLLGAIFGDFFFTRLGDQSAPLEGRSTAERLILRNLAAELVAARPVLGVGAGNYILGQQQLGSRPGPGEPVHNMPLLILVETGPLGVLAFLAALFYAVLTTLRLRGRADRWFTGYSGALGALLLASFFDHYLWSFAPGRTLLWATWGMWAALVVWLQDSATPALERSA